MSLYALGDGNFPKISEGEEIILTRQGEDDARVHLQDLDQDGRPGRFESEPDLSHPLLQNLILLSSGSLFALVSQYVTHIRIPHSLRYDYLQR